MTPQNHNQQGSEKEQGNFQPTLETQKTTEQLYNRKKGAVSPDNQLPADKIRMNWTGLCATSDNRNQCSNDNCTMFHICRIKIPIQQAKQETLKKVKEIIDNLPTTFQKDYATGKQSATIEVKELKQKIEELII